MLILKAHAILHKVERFKVILDEAQRVAEHLDDPKICTFLDECRYINDTDIALKKRTQSVDSMSVRKRRSKGSMNSSHRSSQVSELSDNVVSVTDIQAPLNEK